VGCWAIGSCWPAKPSAGCLAGRLPDGRGAAHTALATALLHLGGIGLGRLAGDGRHGSTAVRSAGGLAALAGLAILAGLL
jgi:hypothetical protein